MVFFLWEVARLEFSEYPEISILFVVGFIFIFYYIPIGAGVGNLEVVG